MRAKEEIERLQKKLEDGSLPPDEMLFTLRAQDDSAARFVRSWAVHNRPRGTPLEKINEAYQCAEAMDEWPIKQVPGRPETRSNADRGSHP